MLDQPDLTAELDDAEQIISGEVEKIVYRWGIKFCAGEPGEHVSKPGWNEQATRQWVEQYDGGKPCVVVRQKVTYGVWQDA